jgi:hypothetical protein
VTLYDQARSDTRAYEKTLRARLATWGDQEILNTLQSRFPANLPLALRGKIIDAIVSKEGAAFLRESLRPAVDRLGDVSK